MNFIRKLQVKNKVVVCDSVSVGQLTSVDFGKLFAHFGVFRKIGSISLLRKLTPSAFNILFGNAETCSILHELMKYKNFTIHGLKCCVRRRLFMRRFLRGFLRLLLRCFCHIEVNITEFTGSRKEHDKSKQSCRKLF